jgi:hypothetical protein
LQIARFVAALPTLTGDTAAGAESRGEAVPGTTLGREMHPFCWIQLSVTCAAKPSRMIANDALKIEQEQSLLLRDARTALDRALISHNGYCAYLEICSMSFEQGAFKMTGSEEDKAACTLMHDRNR